MDALGESVKLPARRSLVAISAPIKMAAQLYRRVPYEIRRTLEMDGARRWLVATGYASWHNARVGPGAPTVHFFPMRPEAASQIVWVLLRTGHRIGFSPRPTEVTIAWDTGTWFSEQAQRRLPTDAINGRCLDISKSLVDRAWSEVAGYSISVDPLTTEGPIVVKPEENGLHAGQILNGPLGRRRDGVVYQRLIDSRDGDRILSTRAVVIGSEIPLAYETSRPFPNWFKGPYETSPRRPADLYSPEERELLSRFALALGLEYGELDVLRDNGSGRIYVVDANRTPIRQRLASRAIRRATYADMAPAMARLLATRDTGRGDAL